MILYLIKNRMILCEGLVDEETDKFVKKEDSFTIKWTSDRIFDARFKVTPLGLGGLMTKTPTRIASSTRAPCIEARRF